MTYSKVEIKKMLAGALEICKERKIDTLEQWLVFAEELRINK